MAGLDEEKKFLASSEMESPDSSMEGTKNGNKEEVADLLEEKPAPEGKLQTHVTFQITPSCDSPKISSNVRHSTENIARAYTMRTKIEEKITEIEKKLDFPGLDSSSESIDKDWNPADYNLIKVKDLKRSRSCSVSEIKQNIIDRLQSELQQAEKELELQEGEVQKLRKIRDEVGSEIEDLTASLFEQDMQIKKLFKNAHT